MSGVGGEQAGGVDPRPRGAGQKDAQGSGGRLQRAHQTLEVSRSRPRRAGWLGHAPGAHLAVHLTGNRGGMSN